MFRVLIINLNNLKLINVVNIYVSRVTTYLWCVLKNVLIFSNLSIISFTIRYAGLFFVISIVT